MSCSIFGRAGEPRDSVGGKGENGYVEIDPTRRYGRFAAVLGNGATKTVYRAFDEFLGMEVAWNQVKLSNVFQKPDELQRFYSEVHLLSTLRHDSIIRFYASWVDIEKKSINFITEMFTSGTLREYRLRYKKVNIRALKNWARQILHGLVYLHGRDPPVIHRDLKCDNIFINGHLGQVKIGDLGLAAILRGSQSAHSVIGTPEFMAPEVYEEEYGELVDVYSFGMCILEMLTSEYPYSECSNPAQIYKKVTAGKMPNAFYRIRDLEAQQFIGKCLKDASKRLSAKDLLHEPFLATDNDVPFPIISHNGQMNIRKEVVLDSKAQRPSMDAHPVSAVTEDGQITITGKLNIEDDTIFLKVQIDAKDGNLRNIYFPFDIINDTPINVATEMVKELEITNCNPFKIAQVIDSEVLTLVPHLKEWGCLRRHSISFQGDEDEVRQPCYSRSSLSSQTSPFGLFPSQASLHSNWRDDLAEGNTSSQSSLGSAPNYNSISECEHDSSPRRQDSAECLSDSHKSRFFPEDNKNVQHLMTESYSGCCSPQLRHLPGRKGGQSSSIKRCLKRMRSMVDVRRLLLHRSLVEEVNKRRLFKTVGDVKSVGFQAPCELPSRVCKGGSAKCSSSEAS